MKKLRKNFKKAVLMFVIVFLLLLEFRNFKLIDALVQRTNQQTNYTQQLEQEVRQLETANARLESNIAYQYDKIQELSTVKPEIKVNYITKQVEHKQEEHKQEKVHIADMLLPKQEDVTTVIIGTLATLGGMVKTLVPQF
jgi:phage shock protein A